MAEAQAKKLKQLNKTKRNNRAAQYIDRKYKNIKFYEKKRLKKQLDRLNPEADDYEDLRDEIQTKIDYIDVSPFRRL